MSGYLYFNYCLEDSKSISNTIKINVNFSQTVKSLITEAQNGINSASTNIKFQVLSVSKHFNSKPLSEELPLKYFFQSGNDIYCKLKVEKYLSVETQSQGNNETKSAITQEVKKAKDDDLKYIVLSKYSWYDDKVFVKVIVPINGVGAIPKENVIAEFGDRSFLIKIVGLNGSNYRFGSTRTHYHLIASESKILIKANEVVVKIKKEKTDDYWSYIYKTRMVGEED